MKKFVAHWVFAYDMNGDKVDTPVFRGQDIEVSSWEELADFAETCDEAGEIDSLEFELYSPHTHTVYPGNIIDAKATTSYRIDWVEGIRRLMKFEGDIEGGSYEY